MDPQIDQHAEQAAPRLEFAFQIRIDLGDTVLFYGGTALGTVHNFQPGIGFSYRF